MYTVSKIRECGRWWLLSAMMMMGTTSALAQLAQTVTVMPPYSNRLSDYIATPGKISSVITVTGMDWPRFEIYLHGSIISSDESVIIRSGATTTMHPSDHTGGQCLWRTHLPALHADLSDIPFIFNEQQLTFKGTGTAGGDAKRTARELRPLRYH